VSAAGLRAALIVLAAQAAGCDREATASKARPHPFHDVRDYGAVADGQTEATEAIRRAIAAASAEGGGTVYFGAGRYLTGPIRLRSNITLFFDAGAVVKWSQDFDDYLPMVRARWEGTEVKTFSPLIYGDKLENVAIHGRGVLDGQGEPWWKFWRELRSDYEKTGKWRTDSKWQKEFAKQNPQAVTKLLKATARGYADAMKDPKGAAEIMSKYMKVKEDPDVLAAQVKATVESTNAPAGKPIGWRPSPPPCG